MKKLSIKFILALITISLITTPIISASYIINKNTANTDEENLVTAPIEINPKISKILQMTNETLLRNYLEDLVAIGPKMTGTYGCKKAAEYISNQFKNIGLDTEYHNWESMGNYWYFRFFKSNNIIGTLNGKNDPDKDILIFNAHYDTVKVSPGANDDGSGVAAVLAAAYVLSQFEFNRTIKFVTFSGEELGLLGSKEYVEDIYEENMDVFVEFNADMIGYAETAEGGKTYKIWGTEDAQWMMDDIEEINENYSIGFTNLPRGVLNPLSAHGGSDYLPFIQYGYESLVFWQSDFNSDYFHTPEDTIEHVNFSYLVNTTRLIVGALAYLADVEMEHPQIKIVSPAKGKLYFEDRILKTFEDFKTIVLDDILICAEVEEGSSSIEKVEFYYDDKLMETVEKEPYIWRLNKFSIRKHTVTAKVYDEEGKTGQDLIQFKYINFVKKK